MKKVIVIGGGAAGMLAAQAAAEAGARVTLLEKNEKLGKKLFITGKGRCNLTNAADMQTVMANVMSNPRFLYSAFSEFTNRDIIKRVEDNGCPLKTERGNRVFPVSDHSSDVIAALERGLRKAGVRWELGADAADILTEELSVSADDAGASGMTPETGNTSGKKILSLALLIVGAVLLIAALWMDFSKTYLVVNMGSAKIALRGLFLVLGALLCLAGLYYIPTVMHHRAIINFIFLFPLIFTFIVTVIIPMFVGIFYSFTDWNGVSYTKMVGFENYGAMFKDPAFIWSLLLTVLFVIVNMILVNLVAFLLALLCTTKLKGVGFFRAAYFLPNLIGGIVLGYMPSSSCMSGSTRATSC